MRIVVRTEVSVRAQPSYYTSEAYDYAVARLRILLHEKNAPQDALEALRRAEGTFRMAFDQAKPPGYKKRCEDSDMVNGIRSLLNASEELRGAAPVGQFLFMSDVGGAIITLENSAIDLWARIFFRECGCGGRRPREPITPEQEALMSELGVVITPQGPRPLREVQEERGR